MEKLIIMGGGHPQIANRMVVVLDKLKEICVFLGKDSIY